MIELWQITGGATQGWSVQQEEDYVYILPPNGMALSFEGEQIMLQEFSGQDNQKWVMNTPNF